VHYTLRILEGFRSVFVPLAYPFRSH
jgi:hypothetical protein